MGSRIGHVLRRVPQLSRFHIGLLVVLAIGVALRVTVLVAYGPAFYFPDTRGYFEYANYGIPQAIRPYGYSAFLNLFRWTGSVWPITITQHVLGLACSIGVYALVRRKGGARWLATVAAAPLALDGYELVIEHYLLADNLFTVLLLSGMLCFLWQDKLSTPVAVLGGLFIGLANLTRPVALPIIALLAVYLLIRKVGMRRFVAGMGAIVIPMVGYMIWFDKYYDKYAISTWQDRWMYGRVMSIADCEHLKLNPPERKLCARPQTDYKWDVDYYVWSHSSPVSRIPRRYSYTFSIKVILQQPLDYTGLVVGETWTYFSPVYYVQRKEPRGTTCPQIWEFQVESKQPNCEPRPVATSQFGDHRGAQPTKWEGASPRFLHAYQRYGGVTPGPFLAVCLLLAFLMVLIRRKAGHWRLRWDALLLGASGLALLAMAIATSQFDIRYGVPVLALIPPAGALAWIAFRNTRTASTSTTASRTEQARTESERQSA